MTRLIAVGDIHGQFDKLVDLMDSVSPSPDDQFVFLGDYIDRGNKTPAVLDWLIAFQKSFPKTVFLRGNHEQMLLDALVAAERQKAGRNNLFDDFLALRSNGLPDTVFYFVSCGGQETLTAYVGASACDDPCAALLSVPQDHVAFLHQTEMFFEGAGFFFVHAGVDPKDPTGQLKGCDAFLWERRPLWKRVKGWNKVVVHGHTPVKEPFFETLEINIDTGAGYDSKLTACDVLTKRIWQSSCP